LPNTNDIKYVKRNDVRLKSGMSEEFNKILLEFIKSVEGKVKGLKGFIVMNSTTNTSEIIVLSLWETESDMKVFYHPSNKALYDFVDRASPLFESKPERTDYVVSHFSISDFRI
jgi:heme-degrading monooxygenase HmoA